MANVWPNRCNWEPIVNSLTKPALIFFALTLLPAWPVAAAAELQPYSARYSVYRNGKLIGKAELEVRQQGDQWSIVSEVSGTHGIGRLIRARDDERVTGRMQDGRFLPDRYERNTRHLGMHDQWLATFDREQKLVTVLHDEERYELPHAGNALDPLSLKIEMRHRLMQGGPGADAASPGAADRDASERGLPEGGSAESHAPELTFMMVEEDEIEQQRFRTLPKERLETSLGCLETLPVEKIRENSSRYTLAWHAPELDYVAVRMAHGKAGGNHMEMRITELTIDGAEVQPQAGCAAMQSAMRPAPLPPQPGAAAGNHPGENRVETL